MNTPLPLTPVRAGFIPLVDCAVLVVAHEKGFAAEHGIDLQLKKEVSWANVRDHVNVGVLDVAHMLAGMPIAQSLGINHIKVPMVAPMALSAGGNAITVSHTLYQALLLTGEDLSTPLGAAQALRHVVDQRRFENAELLSFGQVFPFSCHNYQLRYWMAAAGIDPERDVRLVVIPPPYMVKSLSAGQVDGFCVGEPWNIQAADQGVGVILSRSSQFWPQGPEKVLGLQERWAKDNPQTLSALLKALDEAAQWVGNPDHHAELANLLARPDYLDMSQDVVLAALGGDLEFYGGDAVQTDRKQALWLYAQMARWGQTALSGEAEQSVCRTYRTDLLSAALGEASTQHIASSHKALDGIPFDATDVQAYIAALTIKA